MPDFKLLPMGISDFRRIRLENYYYVDKTAWIPKFEQVSSFLFFCRPRRFGKTLMLSVLESYYDCKQQQDWDRLFNGLWIHEHPTAERSKFQVMKLDFSKVTGTLDQLKESLDRYFDNRLNLFAEKYADMYPAGFVDEVKKHTTATDKLDYVTGRAAACDNHLYLILDEYDNFTNTVLAQHGEAVCRTLTHADGFYRDLFKLFKGNFDRILMMGVSPVTMDDLTSGYNIATNITTRYNFNQVLGFSEPEVRAMLDYYRPLSCTELTTDEMVEQMRPWYDNYCFAEKALKTDPKMFNSNMVTYYIGTLLDEGTPPDSMEDPNAKTDYTKLRQLIRLDTIDSYRRGIVHRIAQDGYIYSKVKDYFPAIELIKKENFISLLYYYGMITMTGTYHGEQRLGIPNNNVRRQYYDFLLDEYQRAYDIDTWQLKENFRSAAYEGEWRALFEYIADSYREDSAIRSAIEGERHLQGYFLAYLNIYQGYLTAPEVELNHGYCDFFLMPDKLRQPDIAHSYIIELKYLKANATDEEAKSQWQEAETQIRQYGAGSRVALLSRDTQLHLVIIQFRGPKQLRLDDVGLPKA